MEYNFNIFINKNESLINENIRFKIFKKNRIIKIDKK